MCTDECMCIIMTLWGYSVCPLAMSPCSAQLSFSQLTSLLYAFKHFPESTPKQWKLVVDFVHHSELDGSFLGDNWNDGTGKLSNYC